MQCTCVPYNSNPYHVVQGENWHPGQSQYRTLLGLLKSTCLPHSAPPKLSSIHLVGHSTYVRYGSWQLHKNCRCLQQLHLGRPVRCLSGQHARPLARVFQAAQQHRNFGDRCVCWLGEASTPDTMSMGGAGRTYTSGYGMQLSTRSKICKVIV